MLRSTGAFFFALLVTACAPTPPAPPAPAIVRGIVSDPERLAFTCVTPGCETTQTVSIGVLGDRRLAIKRILLEDERGEFTFTSTETAPFVLGVEGRFNIEVQYKPVGAPASRTVELAIIYTDASPVEDPERVPPGELRIPMVRRLVGEPLLVATPSSLNFGPLPVGQQKSVPLQLSNDGFGNVALELAAIDAGASSLSAPLPTKTLLAPGEKVDLSVTYAPTTEAYLNTQLVVTTTGEDVEPARVSIEATSIAAARIALEPSGDVNFGELPRTQSRTKTVQLVNQGGSALEIQSVLLSDPSTNVSAALPGGASTLTIAPLTRAELTITLNGNVPGTVDAQVLLATNDPISPTFSVRVIAAVTEPRLTVSPASIDFGTVPVGWVVTRPVELRNTGYGALTVKNITLVGGSSSLFTLRSIPPLPAVLEAGQRVALDVEFRAETSATFGGALSVESDDPAGSFAEVALAAAGGTCEASCPISNGTASCTSGACAVGSCNSGWFDADLQASTGCECQEVGTDPGEFCTSSHYVGTLSDSGSRSQFTGIIPTEGDVDLIRFYAQDKSQMLSDDFDVRINLSSSDPGIRLCIYRHRADNHDVDCYFTDENCPSTRTYRKDGSTGSEDGADFLIKVFRQPGSAPTCTSYTVFMSNG